MRNLLIIPILCLAFCSCKKYEKCDNAELCIKNIGTDTIHYGWNTTAHTQSLAPNDSACTNVGPVDASPTNTKEETMTFDSDHGIFLINVKTCHARKEVK